MPEKRLAARLLPSLLIAAAAFGSFASPPALAGLPADVAAVIQNRCAGCHGGKTPEAGIQLDGEWTPERLVSLEGNTWFRALHEIESKRMPPEEEEQPSDAERATVAKWIRGDLAKLQRERQLAIGRAPLRRLSREEYSNTIYDLFGFRPPVSLMLPEDGRVDVDVLPVS